MWRPSDNMEQGATLPRNFFIVSSRIFRCSQFAGLRQALDRAANSIFGKIGWIASEDVLLQLLKLECIPVLLYALEVCQLLRWDLQSLDFIVSIFMKLIRTNDMSIIRYCQEMFYFELPSITLQKRSEKFEMNIAMLILFYWSLTKFLVQIVCIN